MFCIFVLIITILSFSFVSLSATVWSLSIFSFISCRFISAVSIVCVYSLMIFFLCSSVIVCLHVLHSVVSVKKEIPSLFCCTVLSIDQIAFSPFDLYSSYFVFSSLYFVVSSDFSVFELFTFVSFITLSD